MREKSQIIFDPSFSALRIDCMITQMTLSRPKPACIVSNIASVGSDRETEADHVTEHGAEEYSEQTRWMLAVRDNRDRVAFGKLFDHFAPRLKGVAVRSGMAEELAEEVAQDVFLTVWRKAHLFDPHRAPVSAWIFQIARNRRIDVIRKENRPMPQEELVSADTEEDASQITALEQECGLLRSALAALKPDQREMIERAYLGDLTHKEISDQTGLALGTVKSRIRLGLERLRHELKGLR